MHGALDAHDDGEDDVLASINIIPFVDIVLVLLIIFMVTSAAIVKASLKVNLPKAASGGASVDSTLNIVLALDNTLYLNGQVITRDDLKAVAAKESTLNSQVQAVIAADKGVAYGLVVEIIDIVKTNGVTSFALNIEREKQ